MSQVTKFINNYAAGRMEWADLKAFLVDFNYAVAPDPWPTTEALMNATAEGDWETGWPVDGTFDEVEAAQAKGLLTFKQVQQVRKARHKSTAS